jgi:PucR C-terminal helix-turn-helix domain/GGDEF-like domain
MRRARALDHSRQPVGDRGADSSAPRSTPLTLVSGAVAGGDLGGIAATVAEALGCPVAIAIPALGEPVLHPPEAVGPEAARAIAAHAAAVARGEQAPVPEGLVDQVPVRIGEQIVGIVGAAGHSARPGVEPIDAAERRAWLEAAAAAASVAALIRETDAGGAAGSAEQLLGELAAGPPVDVSAFVARARRLGLELGAGGVAVAARPAAGPDGVAEHAAAMAVADGSLGELAGRLGALVGELRPGRVLALAPLGPAELADGGAALAAGLRERGLTVAVSAPRRDPALLHDAVREAELLAELAREFAAQPAGQDETYRLLIGVLLRDRDELATLRERTVTPLAEYDARHDTELLATLRAFLAHDGSTTETADAMSLHRHTVGYRLSRVHEVSGLSPYESDGRERLSLGIKAHEILEAERRLA